MAESEISAGRSSKRCDKFFLTILYLYFCINSEYLICSLQWYIVHSQKIIFNVIFLTLCAGDKNTRWVGYNITAGTKIPVGKGTFLRSTLSQFTTLPTLSLILSLSVFFITTTTPYTHLPTLTLKALNLSPSFHQTTFYLLDNFFSQAAHPPNNQ